MPQSGGVSLFATLAAHSTPHLFPRIKGIAASRVHFNCPGFFPSYFKLQMRWLRLLTRITYSCKLIGIHKLATCLQHELFWKNIS
ncbi:hypothetical protein CKQ54_08780 [Rahnella variigena]|uniref:Uncharacterized protein n=1 Tax=Rahnella variigena TaxID=574964 RepID=A0ABX9PTT9_9GAMM|nr:hypothetical protein D6D38_02430 [Rahnella variigena]RKF68456.1 hypothetical protein CKQ54_08780 [Rahnella variigena]